MEHRTNGMECSEECNEERNSVRPSLVYFVLIELNTHSSLFHLF